MTGAPLTLCRIAWRTPRATLWLPVVMLRRALA